MSLYAMYSCLSKKRKWFLGWIEEIPGVNTQGKTMEEVKANLKEALSLVLEVNKMIIEKDRPRGTVIRERLNLSQTF